MKFRPLSINDVILIEMDVFEDERGFFLESYNATKFSETGLPATFVQDNHSGSRRGVLRGLHYQVRNTQGKLLGVVTGEVYDVAVDLRRSSPTFGKWTGVRLTPRERTQLWIPPGFAHGFYVLSEWAEIHYKTTDFYAREWERTLLWNDPEIGIQWPLIDDTQPIMSAKDSNGVSLSEAALFD